MDFDALRRAIMAGDGEPPERPVPPASEPTPPPIPRDADSFAARMAGFAGEAAHAEGLIVPEVVFAMPATDEANNASEPASEDAATEPPPTLSDAEAEEPVVQPPEDQAAGYRDLDRALQDAAAAYEERLRNSGAS